MSSLRLVSAGVSAVAVSYGLARYGYGLLLPDMRAELRLSTELLGLIATGSYAAYLAATVAVGALAARRGPRLPVVLGGLVGALGMSVIAFADGPYTLAAGVLVAGASSGLVLPPFADAVERCLRPEARGRALSAISSGTGWGVLASGPVALLLGGSWRAAWLAFATLALAATLWAAWALPGGRRATGEPEPPRLRLAWFVCPRSGPLLAGALLLGAGSSVYWTFAVDYVVGTGALSTGGGRLLLPLVGLASILGTFAGDVLERIGGRWALWLGSATLCSSLALLVLTPPTWPAIGLSALLFGAAYNALVAVQSIWSARVFSARPSAGLGAVMFMLGVGLMVGPGIAGVVAARLGFPAAFVGAAALVACVGLLFPREDLRVAPAGPARRAHTSRPEPLSDSRAGDPR